MFHFHLPSSPNPNHSVPLPPPLLLQTPKSCPYLIQGTQVGKAVWERASVLFQRLSPHQNLMKTRLTTSHLLGHSAGNTLAGHTDSWEGLRVARRATTRCTNTWRYRKRSSTEWCRWQHSGKTPMVWQANVRVFHHNPAELSWMFIKCLFPTLQIIKTMPC